MYETLTLRIDSLSTDFEGNLFCKISLKLKSSAHARCYYGTSRCEILPLMCRFGVTRLCVLWHGLLWLASFIVHL